MWHDTFCQGAQNLMMGHAIYLNDCRSGLIGVCIKCYEKTANEIGRISRSSSVRSREGAFEAEESTYIWYGGLWGHVRFAESHLAVGFVVGKKKENTLFFLPLPPKKKERKERKHPDKILNNFISFLAWIFCEGIFAMKFYWPQMFYPCVQNLTEKT